jgi:hypothetical protein
MEPPAAAVPGAPTNRHISPRELSISVTYPTPKAGTAEERRKTIDGVVESFSAAGAGHFRVYHNGAFSHVVPTSVKRLSGEEAALTSVCDSTVSMPSAKRTIHSSLTEILSQVSLQIKVPIASMASGNLFLGHQYQTEAQGENACDLLSGVMEDVNGPRNAIGAPPVHVAWAMLYDIAGRAYYFNVIPVVAPAPPRQPGLGTYVPQHADAPHSDRQQEK